MLDAILDAESADPKLFVRGAATDPKAIEHYAVELFHRTGERAYVAAASAIDDASAIGSASSSRRPRPTPSCTTRSW